MARKILVVEDEAPIRDMLCFVLEQNGYQATTAEDYDSAINTLVEPYPDLVLLDWMLPGGSGIQIAKKMKQHELTRNIPIIMITARGEEEDKVRGLEVGADDYVTKPFGLEELMLRIAAILRRTIGTGEKSAEDIICGPVILNEDCHSVTLHGKPIDLSPTEFKLLYELMIKQGKVVTKATLLDVVWGMAFAANATVVDTYISYLRKKLHIGEFQTLGFEYDLLWSELPSAEEQERFIDRLLEEFIGPRSLSVGGGINCGFI